MSDQASTIMVNTLEPQSGTTLTVGKSGQNLQVNADSLKANVAKDAGGNAIFTSDGSGNLSGLNSAFGSAQTLISTTTVSTAVADITITSGIDSTYKEYVFEFINIQPVTDAMAFRFQVNAVGESGYNETVTDTIFRALHKEDNTTASLSYASGEDQAQGTSPIIIMRNIGNDADSAGVGELHLFNPSSTTYVKNFYATTQFYDNDSASQSDYIGGYINVTAALNAIQFTFSSGNINAGTIKMYGLK